MVWRILEHDGISEATEVLDEPTAAAVNSATGNDSGPLFDRVTELTTSNDKHRLVTAT